MSESTETRQVPQTGNHAIDAALAEAADLGGLGAAERLARLGVAHEKLAKALEVTPTAGTPVRHDPA